ncbi:thiamine pyrophosphate-dependent enzyme [Shigella flexneri]
MRFWPPAAIGAALANPDREVLCFYRRRQPDDESQEMATASENQLDVKIILMNNEALGLVHQQQVYSKGKAFPPPIRARSALCSLPQDSA